MDEGERKDVNGRMMLAHGICYRLPDRGLNWGGETFAGGSHSAELSLISASTGATVAMLAGYGIPPTPSDRPPLKGSFQPLRTRHEMVDFVLRWREHILARRDELCWLKVASRNLASLGDIMPVRSIGSDTVNRDNGVTIPLGELVGFLSSYHIHKHFF
jgi:hypothetical protein